MQVEWKEIEGAEGYFISNTGLVRGLKGGLYKTPDNYKGYPMLRIPNRKFSKSLHRVVIEHFLGKKENMQVNHIDGDKHNNNIGNLEWVSCRDNIRHAIKMGLRTATSNLGTGKFNSIQLESVRNYIKSGWSNPDIAKIFNCHHSTISKIRTNAHYKIK